MIILDCFVPGTPAAQGSKRHVGGGRMIEMDKKLPAWRDSIRLVCAHKFRGELVDAPVVVTARFYLPRPKRPRFSVPAVPADLDKLCRAVGDSLTGVVLKDDARIVEWVASKHYAEGRTPGVHLIIAHIEGALS